MRKTRAIGCALLILTAVLVGCGTKLVQAWNQLLGEDYVHALWISTVDQQIHLLKTDEEHGARIERFDMDGQPVDSMPVDTAGWTGAHLLNPQDDSVFLLEAVAEQEGSYNLLHQSANGELSRVAINLPLLPTGQHWQVNDFKHLTSEQNLVISARIRNGRETEDVLLVLLSPAGDALAQFSVASNAKARLLALDNGFVWVLNCQSSAPAGGCIMRFVMLDEQLQVVSDSQSMHGDFSFFASVSRLGDRLVVSSPTAHLLVDFSGNVERTLTGLDGGIAEDNSFYETDNGAYALLRSRDNLGYNLCRLDHALQTSWCKFISETDSPLWAMRDLNSYSLRAAVDEAEHFHLSFGIERIYSGVRGSLGPVPAPGVGLSVELIGTRDLDVHHLRYAPDGRRVASVKEPSYSEFGTITLDWWAGMSIDPEQTTAGVCSVADALPLPGGGLLALNHFCDEDGGPYQFQLTRWE